MATPTSNSTTTSKPKYMEIWCLFSVANDYDQPANNLCCWWQEKPDIHTLSKAMGVEMDTDANIIAVVRVSQGQIARIINTDYRLMEVMEGVSI